jgi:predicted Zn-dependent protease
MHDYFFQLADDLAGACRGREVLLLGFSGEQSDFVRFNQGRLRQAGAVRQQYLCLELIDGPKHAKETLALCGELRADLHRAKESLKHLRELLTGAPEDPYLLYATDVRHTEQVGRDRLRPTEECVEAILAAGQGRDLVGLFAQGGVFSGFANSLGQRNTFAAHSFHFEWCFYAHGDKAVKSSYAGLEWSDDAFGRKVDSAVEQLEILSRPPKTIPPGEYRVYLAPAAMNDFVGFLGYGGFGLKAHRTKSTPLLKMLEAGARLHESVSLTENTREGLAPNFTAQGFIKPDHVELVRHGDLVGSLVSPRSAKEYDQPVNTGGEVPVSLDMAGGDVDADEAPARLDEGVYANQLWYLNYSDMPAGRITGMTRFATFWVEGGRFAAPLNVMRFDETIYRALGENLLGLTHQRDFLPSSETYGQRSTASARLPGALIDRFRFTL